MSTGLDVPRPDRSATCRRNQGKFRDSTSGATALTDVTVEMHVLAAALAASGAVMLVLSGARHIRDHRSLLATLLSHRTLPFKSARCLAKALPIVQLIVGVAAVFAITSSAPPAVVTWLTKALAATLYLAMTAYLATLLLLRPGVDCGCFARSEPVTWFSLTRTAMPAGAFIALLFMSPDLSMLEGAVALSLGAIVAIVAVYRLFPNVRSARGHPRLSQGRGNISVGGGIRLR